MKDNHRDGALGVRPDPHVAKCAAVSGTLRLSWSRQRLPILVLHGGLQRRKHRRSVRQTSLLREPSRAFGQLPANPPNEDGAIGANNDDPAPTIHAERPDWHE